MADFIDYLIHIDGYNLTTDVVDTLYFGTSDFATKPSDIPSNQFYDGRVSGRLSFDRQLFGSARLIGTPVISIGSVELVNSDGGLDYLDNYAFGGRQLTIFRMVNGNHSGKTTWLEGKIETATVSYDRVLFTIRDKSFSLDQPIQTNLYLGNNSGGNGIEGDADNIKDTPKPLAYGRLRNVTPVLVNYSKQIYQVHDGSVSSIDNVYDGQTTFTFQADVADNATLQALVVSSGNYATCIAEGLIKLGNIPQRGITVDLKGDNSGSGYIDRAGSIARRIVEDKTDLSTSDLNTASFSTLDTDFNYETGIYVLGEQRVNNVLKDVLGPLNFWTFDRSGLMSVGQFTLASGTPDFEFSTDETEDQEGSPVNRIVNNDPTNGVPVYRLNYRWGRNYTIQTRDNVYTSVSEQTVAFTRREYRVSSTEDSSVQTKYPLSPDLTVTSQLFNQADADTDKTRIFDVYKTKRFFYRFVVNEEFANGIDLNDVIDLIYPRFGLDSGGLLRVVGLRENVVSSGGGAKGQIVIEAFG